MPGDSTQRLIWPRVKTLKRKLDEQEPNLIIIPTLGACSYFGLKLAQRQKDTRCHRESHQFRPAPLALLAKLHCPSAAVGTGIFESLDAWSSDIGRRAQQRRV